MHAFLWAIAGNTLFAALLAAFVWLASRFLRRRPALVHALWILVLLKLVTPPLFDASSFFAADELVETAPAVHSIHAPRRIDPFEAIAILEDELIEARQARDAAQASKPWLPLLIVGAWVIGSATFLLVAFYRASRFAWMVHAAPLADEKFFTLAQLQAQSLGLSSSPPIKVVDACISPLVWQTPWSATIVLPQKLVSELGPDQLRLLLAHELAHVLRGDPLVRWFALGVLTLHWWNPIVWFAVRQIEAAQEACCDSLVLASSGASPKRYAEMLLTTVDFLAGQETPPPALAAGFTSGSSLKGRCEMILSKRTPFALRPAARWMLALLGLAILPLATPLYGQDEKKPESGDLAARVERIEKALEEMKALLQNRVKEEATARDQLKVELAEKMKQDEAKLRDAVNEARQHAEAERARALEAFAKAKDQIKAESVETAKKSASKGNDNVNADLAKIHEEIELKVKRSAEEAAKLAEKLAKAHGEDAAKWSEKLQGEIAEKVKRHAEEAHKYAREHAKHAQAHAEKIAQDVEKQTKEAIEKELPKIKEEMARMQDQFKLEAEKLAKVAEDYSKNPEMKKELEAVREKMDSLKKHMLDVRDKELAKAKGLLKEHKMKAEKAEKSASDVEPKEAVKEDLLRRKRAVIEERLREREERLRDLQQEIERLRKDLGDEGAADRVREVPLLGEIPYISRLFSKADVDVDVDMDADDAIDEMPEIDADVDDEIDVDVELEMDVEEKADEVEEADEADEAEVDEARAEDEVREEIAAKKSQEPLSALEVLKRARKAASTPVRP